MKKYHFILLIFILFLTPNVLAQDFNVSNSDVSSPNSSGTGKYTGTEIYNSGTSNVYNIGTRYNGQLSRIVFNLASGGYADANGFEQGHTYTLTLNMATDDWRNKFGSVSVKCEGSSGVELSNGRVTFVSYKKIKFSFTAPSSDWCQFVYVDLKSTNINSVSFTGVSNWNLSSMVISDPSYSSGGGSGGSGGSGTTTDPNESIINNQNQNTQDIIENNNENTNAIKDAIDNFKNNIDNKFDTINNQLGSCYKNLLDVKRPSGGSATYTTTDTSISYSGSWKNVFYDIPLFGSGTYTLSLKQGSVSNNMNVNIYYVDSNGVRGDWLAGFNGPNRSISFTTTYTTGYIRVIFYDNSSTILNTTIDEPMFTKTSTIVPFSKYGIEVCTSKLDETTNAINDINDNITSDNVDSGVGSDFFDDFEDQDFGLSSIITIPLNTIQSLTSQSCVALNVPIPFTNSSVSLPCMTQVYQDNIPTIYNLWKIVSFGIIAYFIAIDIFHMVKGFKDPESDKVEVLDL